jgi:photosystem II stability/assembly factor-like uncharacterized protein
MAGCPAAVLVFATAILSTMALASPAATQAPTATPAPVSSLVQGFRWRNIGPANMAGRVTDLEAAESNPAILYAGTASGGVWKSVNAGTTWDPIFTRYGTANVGDLAVFQPNPDIVWVGTGEACVRNSVGWGDGVYKSTDGGKTFVNVGLKESHHIGRVLTHPTNPDIAYVASQGHLWSHGGDQGVFRTSDGGRTWRKLTRGLPDDGRTGATELVMDPGDPNILYAGFWERLRQPHRFTSGGPNGGIFKSTDGGESWTKLTKGLPQGATGKVGLSVYRKDPRILVAIVEHGFQPARTSPDFADMTKLGSGIYRSEDGGASWTYLNRFKGPIWSRQSSAQSARSRVRCMAARPVPRWIWSSKSKQQQTPNPTCGPNSNDANCSWASGIGCIVCVTPAPRCCHRQQKSST